MSLSVEEPREGKPWLSLLICLTTAYVFNFLILRAENVGLEFWFQTLQKPAWTLPTILFAPVWTVLSGLIGLAAWQIYEAEPSEAGGHKVRALLLIAAFLMLAAVWAWLFFYWHQTIPARIVSGLLILSAIAGTWATSRARSSTTWLTIPPLLWSAYLTALGLTVHS